VYGVYEGLPVIGGLLRRQRLEAQRLASGLIDALLRDSIALDVIVQRLNIDDIVARLNIDEIVARLDIDAIVARLDVGAIVARLDIDAIVGRLDMNEVVARIDLSKLADQVVEDVDLAKVIMQAGTSVVRGRRPRGRS